MSELVGVAGENATPVTLGGSPVRDAVYTRKFHNALYCLAVWQGRIFVGDELARIAVVVVGHHLPIGEDGEKRRFPPLVTAVRVTRKGKPRIVWDFSADDLYELIDALLRRPHLETGGVAAVRRSDAEPDIENGDDDALNHGHKGNSASDRTLRQEATQQDRRRQDAHCRKRQCHSVELGIALPSYAQSYEHRWEYKPNKIAAWNTAETEENRVEAEENDERMPFLQPAGKLAERRARHLELRLRRRTTARTDMFNDATTWEQNHPKPRGIEKQRNRAAGEQHHDLATRPVPVV